MSEAQACGKVPIQSAFVTDCIAENALLDITDYTLDTAVSTGQGKRGRPGGLFKFAYVESPSIKQEKKERKLDAKKTTSVETPVKKVDKKSAAPSSRKVRSPRTLRSPTPPPLESRKVTKGGKFYFTQPELDYFCQYAQFLLDEDPTLSTTALIQAAHNKACNFFLMCISHQCAEFLILLADATSPDWILAGTNNREDENSTC